jgi:hypothetical protein
MRACCRRRCRCAAGVGGRGAGGRASTGLTYTRHSERGDKQGPCRDPHTLLAAPTGMWMPSRRWRYRLWVRCDRKPRDSTCRRSAS